MAMYLDEIYNKLGSECGKKKFFIHHEKARIITSRLLVKGQVHFEKDVLYVGYLSIFMEGGFQNTSSNFLLIDDDRISGEKSSFEDASANIILLSDYVDLSTALNNVQDLFLYHNKNDNISNTLLLCLLQDKDLDYTLNKAYEHLNNPVILVDSSYKLLAHKEREQIDDPAWYDVVTNGYCSYDMVSAFRKANVIELVAKSTEPVIFDTKFSARMRRMIGKVIVNGNLIGYIVLYEHNRKFIDLDFNVISLLCDVLSEIMRKNSLYDNSSGLIYEYLIAQLLNGSLSDEALIYERLKLADLNPQDEFYLVVINDLKKDIANHHLVDFFRGTLENIFPLSKSLYFNGKIVLIIYLKNKSDDMISSSLKNFEDFLRENRLFAGMSFKETNILNIKSDYEQSLKALQLGLRLNRKGPLFLYQNFMAYHLLDQCRDLSQFCHPGILKLKRYDEEKGSDYYHTLYLYLENNKNISITANQLYIHRNTLKYRIDKILEIISVDIDIFAECSHMYYTYKMLELLNSMQSS